MSDDFDYILDVRGLTDPAGDEEPSAVPAAKSRRWIGVEFECCGVYTRVYRNRDASAYEGACPRCGRPVRIRVGEGGTTARMFKAR